MRPIWPAHAACELVRRKQAGEAGSAAAVAAGCAPRRSWAQEMAFIKALSEKAKSEAGQNIMRAIRRDFAERNRLLEA